MRMCGTRILPVKMNFEIDYRHIHIVRSPQALPLLLLVREWGDYGVNAFKHTDIILLILRGVQPLANFQRGLEVSEILESLEKVHLKDKFMNRFDDVVNNLTSFMDLFDEVEHLLVTSDNSSSTAILDADCSNSIIGIYIRQCVLEYKKLTFSQLMRFHSGLLDYFSRDEHGKYRDQTYYPLLDQNKKSFEMREMSFGCKLKALVESGDSGNTRDSLLHSSQATPGRAELGNEVLRLAELHGVFGHNKEGLLALEEAIRLGEQSNKPMLLQHALSWLLKFDSIGQQDSLVMLRMYIKNAEELKLPLLGLWGRLQQAKTLISLQKHPKTVLQELMTSEVETTCTSTYDDERIKGALHIGMLALLAATWEHYGHRLLALYYAQLICHMTSNLSSPNLDEREGMALAVVIVAKHFNSVLGDSGTANVLLSHYIDLHKGTGLPFRVLMKCRAEMQFDEAVEVGCYTAARVHMDTIATLDKHEGMFRSAVLARREGNITKTMNILQDIIRSDAGISPGVKSRSLQLVVEVYSDLGMPAKAIPYLTKCLAHSQKYNFPQHQLKLKLKDLMDSVTNKYSTSM